MSLPELRGLKKQIIQLRDIRTQSPRLSPDRLYAYFGPYKIPQAKLNSSYYETAVHTGLTKAVSLCPIHDNDITGVWNIYRLSIKCFPDYEHLL